MTEPTPQTAARAEQHMVSAMLARQAGDLAALASRVTAIEDRVEDHAAAFDAIEAIEPTPADLPGDTTAAADADAVPPGGAAADEQDPPAPEVGLDLRRLVTWVRDNIALLLERKTPQTGGAPHWCRKWWQHSEAIARFEAVRRAWAEAVTSGDGNAMVVYFEHLDHHLNVMCAENGPFSGCTKGVHDPGSKARPLGQVDPDEAYFAEFDADQTGDETGAETGAGAGPDGDPVTNGRVPAHQQSHQQ